MEKLKEIAERYYADEVSINAFIIGAKWQQERSYSEEEEEEEQKQEKFEQAVRPLMKYLAENHHPHTSVYVTSRTAELLEGQQCLSTIEYLVD